MEIQTRELWPFAFKMSMDETGNIFTPVNIVTLRLKLHGAIYRLDSFVLMLRYCANLKVIRYESTSLNKIVPDKSLKATITRCDLSLRFFCIDATLLCEFESDKI